MKVYAYFSKKGLKLFKSIDNAQSFVKEDIISQLKADGIKVEYSDSIHYAGVDDEYGLKPYYGLRDTLLFKRKGSSDNEFQASIFVFPVED